MCARPTVAPARASPSPSSCPCSGGGHGCAMSILLMTTTYTPSLPQAPARGTWHPASTLDDTRRPSAPPRVMASYADGTFKQSCMTRPSCLATRGCFLCVCMPSVLNHPLPISTSTVAPQASTTPASAYMPIPALTCAKEKTVSS